MGGQPGAPGRHCRLTVSPACAIVMLVIPRIAHLAQRAVADSPRWTRAVWGPPRLPALGEGIKRDFGWRARSECARPMRAVTASCLPPVT